MKQFRNPRVLGLFITVLFCFLVLTAFLIAYQQQNLLRANVHHQAIHDLELMADASLEALLKPDHVAVRNLVERWGKTHEEIHEIRVKAPNGFVLAEYKSPDLKAGGIYSFSKKVEIGKTELATILLIGDYRDAEMIAAQLRTRLVLAALIITVLLGTALWFIFRKLALAPLENMIDERARALSLANQDLGQEIAERISAEEVLREREEHITLLLDSIAEGIYGVDLRENCTFCNPAALRMLGYAQAGDVIGRNMHQLIHHTRPDGSPYAAADCKVTNCPPTGNSSHIDDEVFWRSNGSSFPVEYRVQPIMREGEQIGVVTTFADITERKRAEDERLSHLRFLESLERVDRAIRQADSLERMLMDVLDTALSIFASDRAWLVYPCDPEAPSWRVPMERTRPEYPGAFAMGMDLPMAPDVRQALLVVLNSNGPVVYDPRSGRPVQQVSSQFSVQSQILTAIYPKMGKPWVFGMHQCSHARVWNEHDVLLFTEIARRIADGLSSLLFLKDLRESQSLLKAVIDNSTAVIYVKDFIGHYLMINRRFEELFHVSQEFVIGKTDYDFFPKEVAEAFRAVDGRVLDTGTTIESEEVAPHDDGLHTYISIKCPLFNDTGKPYAVFGISTDITERKRAEEQLRESEERFRSLVESAPEAIFVLNQGRVVYLNPAMLTLLGASRPEELLGKGYGSHISPEYRDTVRERIRFQRETGKPAPLMELEYLRLDGSRVPVETTAVAIRFQGNDAQLVFARDITERKRAEQALERANTEWSAAMDAATDIVYLLDTDRRLIRANKMFYLMTRSEPNTAVGRHIADIVHPQGEQVTCPMCRAQEERRDVIITMEADHPNNPAGRPIEIIVKVVRDKLNNPVSIFVSLHDLAHERQMQQNQKKLEDQLRQSQKMESIGTLAGGVAHDFNNILTAISGYSSMTLRKMAPDDPLRSNIQMVLEAVERAAHFTRDLLLFSRKQATNRTPVDLNESIQKLGKFLVRVIGEDIEFKTVLSGGTIRILADSNQLAQVLMNLAANARDAMPKGGVFTITTEELLVDEAFVSGHGLGTPGKYALITVSDTGIGMAEETRQRIFEPFFTTKEVGKGTGLGMSVVYGIVKQHDGLVNVYSEPGIGTTFRIYLPVIAAGTDKEQVIVADEQTVGGTETILLAEDDKSVREMIEQMLRGSGYTVITAVDGEDAVNKFMEKQDRIQLLLFDLIMPKRTGKDAYDEIRKTRPDVKIIFASGYDPDMMRQKALLEQNVPVINKPVSMTVLLKKIRSVLDEGRA